MLVLVLAACSGGARPPPVSQAGVTGAGAPGYKVGDPYRVDGVWYHPAVNTTYDQTGIASWYGSKFHGKRTANGEIYDMNLLTAAHKTLPMPTNARVTNLENGRSIVLRINDRGPFVNGRVLDVSRAAADALGFRLQGTARVRVEVIHERPANQTFVAARAETSQAEQNAFGNAPVVDISMTPLPGSIAVQISTVLDNDWSAQITNIPFMPTDLYVQVGAFLFRDNAEQLRRRISAFGPAHISAVWVDNQQFFRVRIGPLDAVADADSALRNLLADGHYQAAIVVE